LRYNPTQGTNLAGDYGQSGVGQNQTHNQNQFGMGGLGGGSGYNQPQQPNTSNSSNYDSGDMDGKNKAYVNTSTSFSCMSINLSLLYTSLYLLT